MPKLETFYILMHRLPDDNEDNAPFQINLGVQGKQLYRLPEPLLVGDHLSKGILDCSETLPSITRAYLRPY